MADVTRADRIAELREQRHLTQEAVVDGLEKQEGRKVISLRGYQEWEAGGGIKWENAKILGRFFKVDPEAIVTRRDSGTPDMIESMDGPSTADLDAKLARIEAAITDLAALVGQALPQPKGQPSTGASDATENQLGASEAG